MEIDHHTSGVFHFPMRTGRSIGRTLYLHDPAEKDPKKDVVVGLVDTRELAAEIVRRWNAALEDGDGGDV